MLELVSVLECSLQAAQLAGLDDAADALIVAAFLHDIGQLLPLPPGADAVDNAHESRGASFLAEIFGAEVLEPIRLHLRAGRYVVASGPGYEPQLSPASAHTLLSQGGPLKPEEARSFEELPFAADAVQLRLYDDRAKQRGKRTPPLRYFLCKAEDFMQRGDREARLQLESLSAA